MSFDLPNSCNKDMTRKTDTDAKTRRVLERMGGSLKAFSTKAADYSASRPDYPAAFFDTLVSDCGLKTHAVIADLGAGTGLLTLGFLQRGYSVVAVEPNVAMRETCDKFLGKFPGYRSIEGTAESNPLENSSVDLVTAAQAFHWFDIEKARTECLRILRPLGSVAIVWNDRAREDPLQESLDKIFAEFGGARRAALAAREKVNRLLEFFGTAVPREYSWPHQHLLGEEGLISLAFSRSYMPGRESAAGKKITSRVRRLFEQFSENYQVTVRYRTIAMTGRPVK